MAFLYPTFQYYSLIKSYYSVQAPKKNLRGFIFVNKSYVKSFDKLHGEIFTPGNSEIFLREIGSN